MIRKVVCPEGHVDDIPLSPADQVFKAQGLMPLPSVPEPIPVEECEVCKGQALVAKYCAQYGTASGF